MSQLIRFKLDDVYCKVRVYEQSSRKIPCVCCKATKFGILFRHYEPVKNIPDTLICNECLAQIAMGKTVDIGNGNKFGHFNQKKLVQNAPRRKTKTSGPKPGQSNIVKTKCPYCDKMCTPQGMPSHVKAKHPECLWPPLNEIEPQELESDGTQPLPDNTSGNSEENKQGEAVSETCSGTEASDTMCEGDGITSYDPPIVQEG